MPSGCEPNGPSVLPSHCDRCGAALDKVLGSNGVLLGFRGCANCYRDYEAHTTFDRKEFLRCDTCKESPCECLARLQQRAGKGGIPTASLSVEAELEAERGRHPLVSSQRKAYIVDESTVSFDDAGGTRPMAGVVCGDVTADGKVNVAIGGAVFMFRHNGEFTDTSAALAKFLERTSVEVGKVVDASFPEVDEYPRVNSHEETRALMLADKCQTLEDEKRELLAENATLRRRVERLERKR